MCYNGDKQKTFEAPSLKEEDAYPALAEDGYGWEKLFSERMCRRFREDFRVYTRVARFHNVYGPWGTWFGGREKAPAAICRKVIEAKISGKHEIEIWGSGNQTRSFMFIDDCTEGIQKIMNSDILEPVNLGSSEAVTINQLVDITEAIAGIKLKRNYDLTAPKGVNGRNSDNTLIKKYLGWEPSTPLRAGMEKRTGGFTTSTWPGNVARRRISGVFLTLMSGIVLHILLKHPTKVAKVQVCDQGKAVRNYSKAAYLAADFEVG
jgi:GDP-D-mannose 3',5'-epimerase